MLTPPSPPHPTPPHSTIPSLGCQPTAPALSAAVREVETDLNADAVEFPRFFTHCFELSKSDAAHRFVSVEAVLPLLELLLVPRYPALGPRLLAFLRVARAGDVLKRDEWSQLLPFLARFDAPGLEAYDEETSWPVLLDEFVVAVRQQLPSPPPPLPAAAGATDATTPPHHLHRHQSLLCSHETTV